MGSGDPGSHLHVCCKSTAPQGLNKSRTTFSLAVSRAWMLRKECIGTASRRKLRWLLRGSYPQGYPQLRPSANTPTVKGLPMSSLSVTAPWLWSTHTHCSHVYTPTKPKWLTMAVCREWAHNSFVLSSVDSFIHSFLYQECDFQIFGKYLWC